MKKGFILLLLLLVFGCCQNGIVVKKFGPAQVLHYRVLQKLDNVSDIAHYAGYIDKGETLPLELNLENDFVGTKQKSIDILIKQKLYFMVKFPENPTKEELEKMTKMDFASMSESELKHFGGRYMLYLSLDSEHWAPLTDRRALKQVLGIKRGIFSFGFSMDKDKGIKSTLTVKTEK